MDRVFAFAVAFIVIGAVLAWVSRLQRHYTDIYASKGLPGKPTRTTRGMIVARAPHEDPQLEAARQQVNRSQTVFMLVAMTIFVLLVLLILARAI